MKVGLVGLAGSGKTTLLEAVAGPAARAGFQPEAVRTIKVADPRMDRLREMHQPKKFTLAQIEAHDFRGLESGSEKGEAELVAHIREVDALAAVLRGFAEPGGGDARKPNPAGDLDHLLTTFQLDDFAMIETRIDRLKKQLLRPTKTVDRDKKELELLTRAHALVSGGGRLKDLGHSASEGELISGFRFLTQKPLLAVITLDDEGSHEAEFVGALEGRVDGLVAIRGRLEREIAELPESERVAFMADFGIKETAGAALVHSLYKLLGLASYFTVGEDEVRAWTIHAGDNAVTAASKIHTDIARGFIRAEVVHYEDLIKAGDMKVVKANHQLRLEGKDYVVKDGDIINFRSGV